MWCNECARERYIHVWYVFNSIFRLHGFGVRARQFNLIRIFDAGKVNKMLATAPIFRSARRKNYPHPRDVLWEDLCAPIQFACFVWIFWYDTRDAYIVHHNKHTQFGKIFRLWEIKSFDTQFMNKIWLQIGRKPNIAMDTLGSHTPLPHFSHALQYINSVCSSVLRIEFLAYIFNDK